MEKITLIVSNIVNSVQVVVDVLINLIFQPVFAVLSIIQNLIQIWSGDGNEDVNEDANEQQQQYTVYPSANEGKYAETCDLPACNEEHHIGFKINQTEQDELDKIKKQLNQ